MNKYITYLKSKVMENNLYLNKKNFFLKSLTIIGILFLIVSCEKQDLEDRTVPSVSDEISGTDALKCHSARKLIDYELIGYFSQEQIIAAVGSSFASLISYGVNVYKITYNTVYKRKKIVVSGAVSIPDKEIDQNTLVVMYNHGTRITEADLLPSSGMDLMPMVSAAMGRICFASDYVGFGESNEYFHPYLINASSDIAIADMALAGSEFLIKTDIHPKTGIYMFGFSQGGLATMSAQRFIENNPYYKRRIDLKAVATGTGPYDLNTSAFIPTISAENYPAPAYIVFTFLAYNNYYGLNTDMSMIFKNSYNELFLDLVAQNKTFAEINAQLPANIPDLMQEEFRNRFIAGQTMYNWLMQGNNSIYGWVPETDLRIYHSPTDEIVPYTNAETAYNTFIDAGATNVELITLPNLTHTTTAFMSFIDLMTWFTTI